VKVFPTTDDAARFKKLKNVILDDGRQKIDMEIASVKFFKNMVIVKFKGIDNINDVEKYRKARLLVTRENAVPLEENEYYIADLIGLSAVSDEGEALGIVTDVLQTGANDVYVITTPDKKEILVPAIRDCILQVDLEKQEMRIHLLPGLRD
jgi:16S rRNA processing protein RimM